MNDSIISRINSIPNRLYVAECDAKDLIIATGDGDSEINEVSIKEDQLMEVKKVKSWMRQIKKSNLL